MTASIIICTHNPHFPLLEKVLHAIDNQNTAVKFEVTIVNNASEPGFTAHFNQLALSNAQMQVISEPRAGLSFARKTGIERTFGDLIIFFDDDNIPQPDYVETAVGFMRTHEGVGILGPGHVEVFLENESNTWTTTDNEDVNRLFQGKRTNALELVLGRNFQAGFPEGTGMCIRRSVASDYAARVDKLVTTGRKGASLTSGEDFQIIFGAFNMELSVGRLPELRIGHYIHRNKQGNRYYRRLKFGQIMSTPQAMQEYYPDLEKTHTSAYQHQRSLIFVLGLFRLLLTIPSKGLTHFNIELGRKLAMYCGYAKAIGKQPLPIVRVALKFAQLDYK